MNFKDVDNIIALGKVAFLKIPMGDECNGCPILDAKQKICDLRPSISLCYAGESIYKDSRCTNSKEI